ncbi:MAG: MBOAT family protein [Lachnospiraceae bacterium]|nr:MBOAT family protein [Lachnospiraceae bacterium]
MERCPAAAPKRRRGILLCCVGILMAALLLFRFLPEGSLVIPIGFSFYSLQAIGYLADVYGGRTAAEKNLLRLALFLVFPITFLSGPIQRTDGLLAQLRGEKKLTGDPAERIRHGLFLMAWGLFLKYAVADRLGPIVGKCFTDIPEREGAVLLFGAVLYAFQLYTDFNGYTSIALGAGEILGFDLGANFDCPYFSLSMREFWNRWHISLSRWLRDYLYFPLGGSRKGTARAVTAILIVFGFSGIWHGKGLQFLVWGLLHGIFRGTEYLTEKMRKNPPSDRPVFRLLRGLRTFLLVDFAWIFFRAGSLSEAFLTIRRILFCFDPVHALREGLYRVDPSRAHLALQLACLIPPLVVDILHYRKVPITQRFEEENATPVRWLCYFAFTAFLLLTFLRSYGVSVTTFIYANF